MPPEANGAPEPEPPADSSAGSPADAPDAPKRGPSWKRFFCQLRADAKLWLFCLAFLGLGRAVFILWFRHEVGPGAGAGALFAVLLRGTRYDSVIASCWTLVPLLGSVACAFANIEKLAGRVRLGFGIAFVAVSTILFRVSIGFFEQFKDVFNHWIFGLYYDDAGAVLTTVASECSLVWAALGLLAVAMPAALALRLLLRHRFVREEAIARLLPTAPRRVAVTLAAAVLFAFAARGSFGRRPVQRKDAAITRDAFLNKAILNPYAALRYAIKDHLRLLSSAGLEAHLPDGDVAGAARLVFATDGEHEEIDAYMLRCARGSRNGRARHVFVVVMESYDAWPLLEKYAALRLTERLKGLAAEGLHVRSYLPGSDGTMSSLATLVTGLPDAGVHVNYRASAREPYPTSVAAAFKRLGYRTRLFYGGYLSWHRIGEFCRAQGFEEVYGGGHMGGWASGNEWGVDDEYLFDFVLGKLDDAQPSFNMILTTTYHPPYDVDVYAKGYPVREVPPEIRRLADRPVDLAALGHLWYADQCLGEFVAEAEARLARPVFAITGDHSGRRHIRTRPGLFERSAVPLVVYGPEVLEGVKLPGNAAGSHLDVGPTLVELAAPAGFRYHAVGSDLLAPRERPLGLANGKVITSDFLLDVRARPPAAHPLPWRELPDELPDLAAIKRLHDAAHGLAWWRVMRGARLGRAGTSPQRRGDAENR